MGSGITHSRNGSATRAIRKDNTASKPVQEMKNLWNDICQLLCVLQHVLSFTKLKKIGTEMDESQWKILFSEPAPRMCV